MALLKGSIVYLSTVVILTSLTTFFSVRISSATKEGAYLHSIGSARVMYTMTRNCRLGKYKDCSCIRVDRPRKFGENWKWSGCNENLKFGECMAQYFIDNLEQNPADRRRSALNLHNNEVGRKVGRFPFNCTCYVCVRTCRLKDFLFCFIIARVTRKIIQR